MVRRRGEGNDSGHGKVRKWWWLQERIAGILSVLGLYSNIHRGEAQDEDVRDCQIP